MHGEVPGKGQRGLPWERAARRPTTGPGGAPGGGAGMVGQVPSILGEVWRGGRGAPGAASRLWTTVPNGPLGTGVRLRPLGGQPSILGGCPESPAELLFTGAPTVPPLHVCEGGPFPAALVGWGDVVPPTQCGEVQAMAPRQCGGPLPSTQAAGPVESTMVQGAEERVKSGNSCLTKKALSLKQPLGPHSLE